MAEVHFNNGDAISAAVLTGLGGYIVMEARQWDYMAPDGPGPGFFPMWYGIALIAISLIVIIGRIYRVVQGDRSFRRLSAKEKREIGHALAVWAVFALCIALLKVLGFLIAFGLFTYFIVAVVYGRSWKAAALTAVATAAGFYLVFDAALSVSLPVGVLGL